MREGSLEAPSRHAIAWRDAAFYDRDDLDKELRRVFDICHGCRRCFNLCDSFPRLFDMIDDCESGELDGVDSQQFKAVADACTLCDMCFLTKCPYVPPHEWNVDFPHLMLRARVKEFGEGKVGVAHRQLTQTDRNGKLAAVMPSLTNWASKRGNALTRPVLESVAGVHRDAELPKFHKPLFENLPPPTVNAEAPARGRKVALYATCFVNYNNPDIGSAARKVLAHNGVETEIAYPGCCGMPQLEQGDIRRVAANAESIAANLVEWVDKGYDIVALTPSCALMLKFEYPLIVPENDDVQRLSKSVFDIAEYIVDISSNEGLAPGLSELDGSVALHFACHARAQNMGPKAKAMLELIPGAEVGLSERCSGHGGSWGIMKENFETGIKVGRPAARQAMESGAKFIVSECPLARNHIVQGIERLSDGGAHIISEHQHPIQLMALAYGLD
ncbi:MAG: glycerol-3-phosphate dehydrogenase [Rhodospirillales bacterium]|nr:glycerol-3-phosphate dehydrogenase [Rhodospirillales bacterium]